MGKAVKVGKNCILNVLSLTTSLATTEKQDIGEFSSGSVHIPALSSVTTLTFHVAPQFTGTYNAAHDGTPAAITMTVAADRSYPLPAAIFGSGAFAMVANAAGDVTVNLKS